MLHDQLRMWWLYTNMTACMSRVHGGHTYLLWAFACFIYLIAVKHVLSNVDWSLNIWVHLRHRQGSTVPRLCAVLCDTVLIQVGSVQFVKGLGTEIAWQSLLPLWVRCCIREVPATPWVPHNTCTLHLLSQKVNVVESTYATSWGTR